MQYVSNVPLGSATRKCHSPAPSKVGWLQAMFWAGCLQRMAWAPRAHGSTCPLPTDQGRPSRLVPPRPPCSSPSHWWHLPTCPAWPLLACHQPTKPVTLFGRLADCSGRHPHCELRSCPWRLRLAPPPPLLLHQSGSGQQPCRQHAGPPPRPEPCGGRRQDSSGSQPADKARPAP